ncbi:MAG: metallophosphoesterase family protein [Bacteroidia bacterium]
MKRSKITLLIYLSVFTAKFFAQSDTLNVAVVGDTPYKITEWKHFKRNIKNINANEVSFLIHVGDIKRGYMPCYKNRYKRIQKYLEKSPVPYLIIPGDNEYNDCYCLKPHKALKTWRKYLINSQNSLNEMRNDSLPENFYFLRDSILFIGINNVGGKIHDTLEWKQRTRLNIQWIEEANTKHPESKRIIIFSHAAPRKEFGLYQFMDDFTKTLNKDLWWVQGDIHTYTINHNWQKLNYTRAITDNGIENNGFQVLSIPLNRDEEIVFR